MVSPLYDSLSSLNFNQRMAITSDIRGEAEFLKLNEHNFSAFRRGLPISALPVAFQDAISITMELGIRFIWIDSLCILQGTDASAINDFNQECSKMSKIYSNSHCNIVATFGKNPHDSLFSERSFENLQIAKASVSRPSTDVKLLQFKGDIRIFYDGYQAQDTLNCEVSLRGWIMQELFLSPRALYFGRNQVHWQCKNLEACETWPDRSPEPTGLYIPQPEANHGKVRDHESLIIKWHELINRYSGLALTEPTDRLVALSGIAAVFQSIMRDDYVCGNWRTGLQQSLTWFKGPQRQTDSNIYSRSDPVVANSPYTAPSWSWASFDGPVRLPTWTNASSLSSITSVSIKTTGDDPTGRVTGGEITIEAPVWTTTVENYKAVLKHTIPDSFFGYAPHRSAQQRAIGGFNTVEPAAHTPVVIAALVSYSRASEWGSYSKLKSEMIIYQTLRIGSVVLIHVEGQPGTYRRVGNLFICFNFPRGHKDEIDTEHAAASQMLEPFGLEIVDKDALTVTLKDGSTSVQSLRII